MDAVALLVFCATIVLAFVFKVNTGLIAIVAALVLSRFVDIGDKWLLNSFDSSLFLMLLGVMYLFCIAQENKTLDVLAKKLLALCKGKTKLFPPLLFLISAFLSAIGPGLISATALMASMTVALARQSGIAPIKLLPFGTLGSFAGGLSPIAPSGIVAISKATESGINGIELPLFLYMALANCVYAAILYFFVFKCHKFQNVSAEKEDIPRFTGKQMATLISILLVAVCSVLFNTNVGLLAFAAAVLLTIFRCADEGAALKKVPWGTLIMITGVGILISLVTELGGIDLLRNLLSKLVSEKTAAGVMALLAGCMSLFSSSSGVVMPTLIPTVPDLVATLGGGSVVGIVVSICIGSHGAAISPLSTCGGLMLSAYSSSDSVTVKERNKMFVQLFALAGGAMVCHIALALLGVFG